MSQEKILIGFVNPDLDTIVDRVKLFLEEEWKYSLELLKIKEKTYDNYIMASKDEFVEIQKEITGLWHIDSVNNSEKIEKVVQELIPIFSEFDLRYQLDRRFYEALCEMVKNDKNLTPLQLLDLNKKIKNYELGGIDLPDDEKVKLAVINEKLELLSNEFNNNTIEANAAFKYILSPDAIKSLPEQERDRFKTDEGVYLVGNINDYVEFMKYSSSRKDRADLHKLYVTRAPKNENIIDQILKLREEKREMLGYESYAELILEKRDASSVSQILEVFEYLTRNAKPKALEEIEMLRGYAKEEDGIESFEIFDLSYYAEKYRKKYFDVDENEYKPYFEVQTVIKGFIEFIKEYSGIDFIQNTDTSMEKWHEDVLIYDLKEGENTIGRIYYDLHEREHKSSGAWKSSVVQYHKDHNGNIVLPVCNVVCNFDKKDKNGISLLRHSDVVTFFHEMGHAIHHLFSKVEVSGMSGTSVDWDVVEFPSQFLEYFAYERKVLQQFARHHKTKEVLPDAMIEKLQSVKNYLNGYATMRQAEFALFDMELHKGGIPDVLETIDEVRGHTSVLDVPEYDRFHCTFGHIFAGGYAAGYYSYKWAEILSAGAYLSIQESGDVIGKFREYKELVLEVGGTENMVLQYKKLTGESPNPLKLLKMDGIVD